MLSRALFRCRFSPPTSSGARGGYFCVFPAVAFGLCSSTCEAWWRGHARSCKLQDTCSVPGGGPLASLATAARHATEEWAQGACPKPDSEERQRRRRLAGMDLPRCYSCRRLYTDFVSSPRNACCWPLFRGHDARSDSRVDRWTVDRGQWTADSNNCSSKNLATPIGEDRLHYVPAAPCSEWNSRGRRQTDTHGWEHHRVSEQQRVETFACSAGGVRPSSP